MATSTPKAGGKPLPAVANAPPTESPLARYVEERTKDLAKDRLKILLMWDISICHEKPEESKQPEQPRKPQYWGLAIQKAEPQSVNKSLEFYGLNMDKHGNFELPATITKTDKNAWGFIELGDVSMSSRHDFIDCITSRHSAPCGNRIPLIPAYAKRQPKDYIVRVWDKAFQCGTLSEETYQVGVKALSTCYEQKLETRKDFETFLEMYSGFSRESEGLITEWRKGKKPQKKDLFYTMEQHTF